jgi:hypothetical protein
MREYYPRSVLRVGFVGYRYFDDGVGRFVVDDFTEDIAKVTRTI